MTRIPSTDPSTWNAMFQVGDKVKIRVDMEFKNRKDELYTIKSFETAIGTYDSGKGFQRPENPSGRLYHLSDNGGSWEGKDLELVESSTTADVIDQSAFPTPSLAKSIMPSSAMRSKPKSKDKGILVELGLSKSQIKQLPKSIVDEAEFIDGIRKIVDEMTDDVRKSIMQQSIVEAIDIFKNSLLEQEDVELTDEQKKEIEDYKSQEEKERQSGETEDEEPRGGEDEEPRGGEDEEPRGSEDEEPKGGQDEEPRGGEDEEPKRGRSGEDEEPKGGTSGGKSEDQGGEDIPSTSGGGGGGGGGTPPSIPDDAYPIPELNKTQKFVIDSEILQKLNPYKKATKWEKEDGVFFGLSVEEFLGAWNLFILHDETGGDYRSLDNTNLFSLIKYLWEWNKGYPAKVLDRYYIYTQYVPFLSFMAAGSHLHTNKFKDNYEVFNYDIVVGNKIPMGALAKPIPNYSQNLEDAGFYGGKFDTEDYKYFYEEYILPKPYPDTSFGDSRLYNLFRYQNFFNRTDNYINDFYGAKTQINQKIAEGSYVERYANYKYNSLILTKEIGIFRSFSVDTDGVVKSKSLPKYAQPYDFQKYFNKENLWYNTIDKTRYKKAYNILRRIQYAYQWFASDTYNLKINILDEDITFDVHSLSAVYQQFLRFGSNTEEDNITFSVDENFNTIYIHREGSEFDAKGEPNIFQSFSFLRGRLKEQYTEYAFPFPELDNSLEWSKVASIAFTSTPTTTSTPAPTKKAPKPISDEKQQVKNEITALKQALKYLSGEEAESVKNEIEALKQSLKYI